MQVRVRTEEAHRGPALGTTARRVGASRMRSRRPNVGRPAKDEVLPKVLRHPTPITPPVKIAVAAKEKVG